MIITQLKCFGSDAKTGNLAYVIESDTMDEVARQQFAFEQNVPVCVFIDSMDGSKLELSFFYPHKKSPLCLHGSLAAAKVFFARNPHSTCIQIVSSMGKILTASLDNGEVIFLELVPEFIRDGGGYIDDVSKLLGIDLDDILIKPLVASVGSPKLIVKINSKEKLFSLKPDLAALNLWNEHVAINGIYAYYQEDKVIFARNFNHLDEKIEDSATGVAAAALGYALSASIKVIQGGNLDNSCVLDVRFENDTIKLTGNVFYL
ncbi:PhzF family phenazine biosynthesis protein [Aquella oligotrophica]|uniref:PhzF family phenazine biosynthesis protein n=1 Tax=Aquella oligotrophica TaxID=2067065 RepID=A0A2I7N4I3_9NEIS|nr:PhzF family phenazine biosynthesis protein [Aquella oligotrophica]AUR51369.1 PhzF family phenazine biosynthesis protein [Aquella oligotrophica]